MIERIPFVSIQPPQEPFRIVKAAVKHGDQVYTGWRHADIISHLRTLRDDSYVSQDDQGFVDQHGSFYNRYQSARIAYRARQILKIPPTLTSEDLWEADGTPREPGEPYDPMGDRAKDTKQAAVDKAASLRARTRGRY